MSYFIIGIAIILFLIKTREWKEKADAYDRNQFVKASVYLPSMKELVQSREERKWRIIFDSFFDRLTVFIREFKWSKALTFNSE